MLFQEFKELLEKTLHSSLLETVESGLISSKFNLDRERETPADICFICSPSGIPVPGLLDNISPK